MTVLLNVFKYSRRAGTKAAGMSGQVEEAVKAARSDRLLQTEAGLSLAYRKRFLGQEKEVLMEEKTVIDGREYLMGHTREYVKAAMAWDHGKKGQMVRGILREMISDEVLLLEEKIV